MQGARTLAGRLIKEGREARIIIPSAGKDPNDVLRARAANAPISSADVRAAYEAMEVDAMIEKPFSVEALRAKLDQLAA